MTATDEPVMVASSTDLTQATFSPIDAIRFAAGAVIAGSVFVPISIDPDLYGHIRYGLDIIDQGGLHVSDPYSFASDRAWVNHEWLAEVLMGLAWSVGGTSGLSLMKALVLSAAFLLMRRRVAAGPQGDLLLVLAVLLAGPLLSTFRPQMFSVLLFAWILDALGRRRTRWLELPGAMLLWANLHGGWLVGAGVIAVWIGIEVLERRAPVRDIALVAACAAATLVTPYGPGLWLFLWDTVGLGRADISEWQPVHVKVDTLVLWLLASALALFAFLRTRALPPLVAALMLAAASSRVLRLVPFFGMAVIVGFGAYWPASRQPAVEARQRILGYALGGAVAAAAVVVCLLNVGSTSFGPSFTIDREAAGALHSVRPTGRMVVYFDWSQYAIWHWGPELQVSYDGRRETVYSGRVIAINDALYRGHADGLEYLDTLEADWIWLPKKLPPVRHLIANDRWVIWYETDRSVIFARPSAPPAPPSTVAPIFP